MTNVPKIKKRTFLSHCGVSPLHQAAAEASIDFIKAHQSYGSAYVMGQYDGILDDFKATFAELLKTSPRNIAATKNTTEAFSMVAEGYPFQKGDEIISFVHEYPANHFPWKLQARKKGVRLKLIPSVPYKGVPHSLCGSWKLEHIEALITKRTRIIAISHVQFTSGFAADLPALGKLCKDRNIDLVVDVAQSLGSLPVYPDQWNIAAVASAGWKWLLGPVGVGVFYTSPAFRAKLAPVLVGAETMQQCPDYLDHAWRPHVSAKRFEYATSPVSLLTGISAAVKANQLTKSVEQIRQRIFYLQDIFLEALANASFQPLIFPAANRSGILSLYHPQASFEAGYVGIGGVVIWI